ncbi:transposase [Tolypothrix bouteillei VB521301_2]|uniref:transposase n=1 Tax=Tolypothrix bouteillei TaxID=1246981 RepID=UPI0038B5A5D7
MTPNKKNQGIPEQFVFEQVKSCPVIVDFKGKPVTSDAGLTLIAELDRKREITSRLAICFKDFRLPVAHSGKPAYSAGSPRPKENIASCS